MPVTIPIIWDAGTFVGRGAGMRFTTDCLARGFQALALALVRLALLAAFFTSDVGWVTFIRNILLPQNGAEQGEDAQQREERCHHSC